MFPLFVFSSASRPCKRLVLMDCKTIFIQASVLNYSYPIFCYYNFDSRGNYSSLQVDIATLGIQIDRVTLIFVDKNASFK
jgi:hypothetical protein